MRYDVPGLRSNTLAHILSAVGIASILRECAKVGWDAHRLFPYIETEVQRETINAMLENGIEQLMKEAQILNTCYSSIEGSSSKKTSGKSQGKRGRKPSDDSKNKPHGLIVARLNKLLDDDEASPTLREMAVSMASIVSIDNGLSRKPRSMLAKTLLYRTAANDLVRYKKMKGRLGILDELASSERMATWISNSNLAKAKGATGYDHVTNMPNLGINQSKIGDAKFANPIVEMLAIDGLRALPSEPIVGSNPRNRGMKKLSRWTIQWTFPIWGPALSYYAIEDLFASNEDYYANLNDGILETRSFEIVRNGNSSMSRPVY